MNIEWQWRPKRPVSDALVDLARQAAESAPDQPEKWVNCSSLATLLQGQREGLDAAVRGIEHCPEDAELHFLAAQRHRALGEFQRAIEECGRALELDRDHAQALLLRFRLLVKTGQIDGARELIGAVAETEESQSDILEYLGTQLSEPGVAEDLLERSETELARNPSGQARYYKALALATLRRASAAAESLSPERQAKIATPPAPSGYATEREFLDALADEILRLPSLRKNPSGKATAGGLQSDTLDDDEGEAIAALFGLIREAVEEHAGALEASGEPLPAPFPMKCSMQAWAVVLGPEGRQTPHRHPDGWLSGVYYVRAPRDGTEGSYRGDLLIGAIDETAGIASPPPWGIRHIEPVPGRLVVFPSYMPHATEPSGIEGERISVAFDVMLVNSDSAPLP